MASIVVGTAGHVDHGKTALLRALTGIDADRLPEERARGMTIEVGFAHLGLPDGSVLDFVDVPGHDRLVGNMLVGAGEIDAALLVVAADDGPRAQTLEHLELLDALGVVDGVAAVSKADLVDRDRRASVVAQVAELLRRTHLAGAPVIEVSAESGEGIAALREALLALRDRVTASETAVPAGPVRLSIDRAFTVRGRGAVVTGTLRGGALGMGDTLRLEPGGLSVRVREVQVHNARREGHDGGRTALNLAAQPVDVFHRGDVLTRGPGIEPTDRLLVALGRPALVSLGQRMSNGPPPSPGRRASAHRWPPPDRGRLQLHIGTAEVDAIVETHVVRGRQEAVQLADRTLVAIVRLSRPIATFVGDRGVLRRPAPPATVAAVRVLDPRPPRGVSRRRVSMERLADLAGAVERADGRAAVDALVGLHGAVARDRLAATLAALGHRGGGASALPAAHPDAPEPDPHPSGAPDDDASPARQNLGRAITLAPDIVAALRGSALAAIAAHHDADPMSIGLPIPELRRRLGLELRRVASIDRSNVPDADLAISSVIEGLLDARTLLRARDRVRDPSRAGATPAGLAAAMARLEGLLDVAAPPALREAARLAGCPPDGITRLEAEHRIERVEADLAWSSSSYRRLAALALGLARKEPLSPAAFRDASGTSRRYVVAILEDLDRRGILVRTTSGHVPGPQAPRSEVPAPVGAAAGGERGAPR